MPKPTAVPGLGPRTRVSVAGPLLVRARLADLRRYEGALSREGEPDPDAVHDARVAARRLRAALQLLGDAELLALEPEVKALQDALGAVRDVQVQRAWLRDAARGARAADAEALAAAVDTPRPELERKLRRALRAWRGAIAPALERAAPGAAARGRLGGKRLAKAARKGLRRLARRADAAAADPAPAMAHRLRIATKRLRYVAELIRRGRPEVIRRLLEELVRLQERLGELHDTDVRVERLADLGGRGPARARATARALLGEVRRDRTRQEQALRRELERWREADLAAALERALDAPRRRGRAAARRLPPPHTDRAAAPGS
jgi:CHAD domain-containing protein